MKKNLILYALLLIYILINVFVLSSVNVPLYNEVINPLIWFGFAIAAYYLSRGDSLRYKDRKNKMQSLAVVLFIYLICYILLGVVFGYQNTPYAKSFLSILRNLWSFGSIIFFQEYVRNAMIRIGKKQIINFVIIALLFSFANISYVSFFSHLSDIREIFTYVASIIIPLFVANAILTYLSYIGGTGVPIIYRCLVYLPEFLFPVIPSLDWFLMAVLGLTLPIAIFIYMSYIHTLKTERLTRREKRKYNPYMYIPALVFIVVIVCFVIGAFKYQPVAVLSGSMSPTFNRGDAVVVKKLTPHEKDDLVKGDVIEFVSGSKFVVHRIAKVTNDRYGNRVFITRGDANNANDVGQVEYADVIGEVSLIIPYIGYPSVWLSGMVS